MRSVNVIVCLHHHATVGWERRTSGVPIASPSYGNEAHTSMDTPPGSSKDTLAQASLDWTGLVHTTDPIYQLPAHSHGAPASTFGLHTYPQGGPDYTERLLDGVPRACSLCGRLYAVPASKERPCLWHPVQHTYMSGSCVMPVLALPFLAPRPTTHNPNKPNAAGTHQAQHTYVIPALTPLLAFDSNDGAKCLCLPTAERLTVSGRASPIGG
ncbi:hypothetical protein JB92DRAFT_1757672 [Gautieria morchelliformis]|nr:hypothetical protein JB92DRAFT_1757672 [Gautieria morchelliformis]